MIGIWDYLEDRCTLRVMRTRFNENICCYSYYSTQFQLVCSVTSHVPAAILSHVTHRGFLAATLASFLRETTCVTMYFSSSFTLPGPTLII